MYAVRCIASFHFIGGVLIPFFTDWAHVSVNAIPLIQLWFMWWAAILEVPTGAVADLVSRKASIWLGLLVSGIGFWVYVIQPSLAYFLVGEFLIALGIALVSGADESLLYDSLIELKQSDRATAVSSRYGIAGMVGILLGAPMGSFLGVTYGLQLPHLATGAALVVGAIVALWLKEPTTHKHEPTAGSNYGKIIVQGFRVLLTHRKILWLGIDVALVHALAGTVIWLNQLALEAVHIPIGWYGTVFTAGVLAEIVLASAMDRIERSIGFIRTARYTAWLPIAGFALMIAGIRNHSQLLVLIGTVLAFSVLIGRRGLIRAQINHQIPSCY
jgi:fucose permease